MAFAIATGTTISTIKTQLESKLLRSNRFEVTLPTTIPGVTWDNNYQYLIKNAPVPTKTNGTIQRNWFGMTNNLIGDPTFDDWNVTFLVNNTFSFRSNMEKWFKLASNPVDNVRETTGYKGDIRLYVYDITNTKVVNYLMVGCFPVSIQQIPLDQATTNQFAECTVTFSIDQFSRAVSTTDTTLVNF